MTTFTVVRDGPDTASIVEAGSNAVVIYFGRALRAIPSDEADDLVRALEEAKPEDWSVNPVDTENEADL
jgi:hypothetical protein